MSLLRSLVLTRNLRRAPHHISKLQDANAGEARRFSAAIECRDQSFGQSTLTSRSDLSSVPCRTYAKAVKGGGGGGGVGGKKSKGNKQFNDILDDLVICKICMSKSKRQFPKKPLLAKQVCANSH